MVLELTPKSLILFRDTSQKRPVPFLVPRCGLYSRAQGQYALPEKKSRLGISGYVNRLGREPASSQWDWLLVPPVGLLAMLGLNLGSMG